jgi:hypothetical protein
LVSIFLSIHGKRRKKKNRREGIFNSGKAQVTIKFFKKKERKKERKKRRPQGRPSAVILIRYVIGNQP